MSKDAYGITIFCDDIRTEDNGKFMLIGCYLAEMNFSGPPPGVLPVFCALVNVHIPIEEKFDNFAIKVTKKDADGVVELFSDTQSIPKEVFESARMADELSDQDDSEKILSLAMPVKWSPLVFNGPCSVRVRLMLSSGQEIKAGSLKINFPLSQ